MAKAKYYEAIEAAQRADPTEQQHSKQLEPFDLDGTFGTGGRFAAFKGNITNWALCAAYSFSRRFKPLLYFAGLLHVTRDEQVRDILHRPQDFEVPFGPEMAQLGLGATFLLGLEGEGHGRLHRILHSVIYPDDLKRITAMSADFTEALLANSNGRIDVIQDLIKRVPAEICLRYFGLHCDRACSFGDWTIALSAWLFGDPYGDPNTRVLAMNARRRITAVIEDAIVQHKQAAQKLGPAFPGDTLVARLISVQQKEPLSDTEIAAMLMGLATGFIPTNTLASANMLTELLNRPDAMAMAYKAAMDEDSVTMARIIQEAGRLNPALAPGQWRYCPRDTTLVVDGKVHKIKAGTTLLVSTMSAMRDRRVISQPSIFRIDRQNADGSWQEPDLLFGVGPHACIGKQLALAQIGALFTILLKRPGLRRAKGKMGRIQNSGPFPRHMFMEWDAPEAMQNMYLVVAPLRAGISVADAQDALKQLGNPAHATIRTAMDATGLVHFCSLAPIETEKGPYLSFELSCDGTIAAANQAIAKHTGAVLQPILALTGYDGKEPLAAFLDRHVVTLHGKLWGATGLNYNGLAEFPVSRVEKQARFADFAGRVLRDFVVCETDRGSHPMLALQHLRRILRGDAITRAKANAEQIALMNEAALHKLDAFHLSTQQMRLNLSRFRPASHTSSFMRLLASRDGWYVTGLLLSLTGVSGFLLSLSMAGDFWQKILPLMLLTPMALIGLSASLLAVFLWLLRRKENSEEPDTSRASDAHLQALMAVENTPGYAQSHILAVGRLKQGWFRTFLHAFALWGIKVAVTYWYRPGFVLNMGTIHYARWWRLPGTRTVAFYSNFDGSWESYLEDFITRARWGQTASWSNWEGFPKSRFLIMEGAGNGDAFKRWVRTRQRPAPFWYGRFPALTSDQIRNNGQIHLGAGLAQNSTEAEEWMRCFSSMPRSDNKIETDEVQALLFRGMKRLPYSNALSITLPVDMDDIGTWLGLLRGETKTLTQIRLGKEREHIPSLIAKGYIQATSVYGGIGSDSYALSHPLTIAFGDRPLTGSSDFSDPAHAAMGQAVFLALSAAGFGKFPVPGSNGKSAAHYFPDAFRLGMASRSRILGDRDLEDPQYWRWSDQKNDTATQAVLLLYATAPEELRVMTAIHKTLLENLGGHVLTQTECAPAWKDSARIDFEHFGYRDGISQPVMRNSNRSTRGVPQRDILEPGEFLLGYKNGSGYFPPSPHLPLEADMRGTLPAAMEANPSRYTDFGDSSLSDAPRDLGRNGSFLVIRELAQDVDGFEAFAHTAAKQLSKDGFDDLYKIIGQRPNAEWVKAKLMGRWPDGRPLIGNPIARLKDEEAGEVILDNDFAYGEDDPQGLACPFGAHIRRSNPRDSKQPGDAQEQAISNRHRLLRRGRPYTRSEDGERGLYFACFCSDIERQFEFVQQFWSNAPSFHDLDKEPDAIIGASPIDPVSGAKLHACFTIPTAAGPVRLDNVQKFVQVKAGGYFFMPSRSALAWLTDIVTLVQIKK